MQLKQCFTRLFQAKRILLTLGLLVLCQSVFAQQYKPEQFLSRVPTQPGIDVDYPSDAETAQCKVKTFKEGTYQGVALYAPNGTTLLRAWCAPAPKAGARQTVEQIRFYKNGQEVYRDVIGKEARWLNAGGSKRGALGADKKTVEKWILISPEEATAEIVAALVAKDFARFQRVAATADDMKAFALTGSIGSEVQKQIQSVTADSFAKLAQSLNLPEDARWGAFNTSQPATIPAANGSASDLTVYYNSAIVVMKGDDASQNQQIYVGDLVKIGDAWKILGLPNGETFGQATGAVSASSIFFPVANGASAGSETANDMGEAGVALSEAFQKLDAASPQEYPALCDKTIELMLNIAENNPQERENMISQAVDVVFAGVQSQQYPNASQKLAELAELCGDGGSVELKAHIRHRQIVADFYTVAQAQPQPKPTELAKAQEKYSEGLAAFVEEFSNTTAGAEAAMSLALDHEYMLDSDSAVEYYQKVAQNFGDTTVGQKAAGAVARLQAEGGKLNLPAMKYFGGGVCDFSAATDKPTVIFCWGSWEQESVEAMKKLAGQVNVIGVNVDSTSPEESQAYYQQIFKGIPWKNVCDPAGLDGLPAVSLGVQTAPWMILIDKSGKVVRSNFADVQDLQDSIKELK